MKRFFVILSLFICGILAFSFFNFSSAAEGNGNTTTTSLNNLINQYVDETATYVKNTKIHLNETSVNELLLNNGFHADVSILERTTYYKGSELWMSTKQNEDGQMVYSYYGTAEGNTGVTSARTTEKLVTPADAKVVLSGEGKNSMQEYYVGLEDIVAKDYHNWELVNGVYTTTNPEVIEWFKAFTAPCYVGFTTNDMSNYITLDKATISLGSNFDLVLNLHASQDYGKFTSGSDIFSTATIEFDYDSVFTEEVLANKFELDSPHNAEVLIDFYATRANDGVYVKFDYLTKELHTTGDWWQQDNVEMRFNNPEGKIPSIVNGEQWILSTNGYSNFDYYYISPAQNLIETTGYYYIEFSAYVSNATLGINENTPLGFTMGSNPGGKPNNASWFQTEYFDTPEITLINKITEKGILRYCLEENCPHKYGEYVLVEQPTCSEDGRKEAHCLYCNEVDSIVVESTGEHVLDMENITVVTPSTCSINGTALAKCGCGYEEELELELDLTSHGEHWNSETNVCACGSLINNLVVDLDHANFHYLDYVMDGTKDFEFDIILNNKRNASSEEWGHSFTGEIYSPGWLNGGWSYRTDWAGWGSWAERTGQASYTDVNNGLWRGKYHEASADMDIIYNLKYFAAEGKFVITMTYHSNVEPYSAEDKHLTYTLSGVGYKGEMHVGFGVEKAKATFKYVKYTVGEAVGPLLDGKMDDVHWTEEVTANSVQLRNGDDAILDLYATRDDFAVYFFAKFQVRELKDTSDNWWEKDNVELRLLVNGAKAISVDGNVQWYVSRTGKWLCNNAYITEAVFNEETGYYEFAFEFYAANSHLKIDANTEVGFTYSMVTYKGWQSCPDFETTDMNLVKKITKEGIR